MKKRVLSVILLACAFSLMTSAQTTFTETEVFEAEVRKAPKIESNLLRKETEYKNKYHKFLLMKLKESNRNLY